METSQNHIQKFREMQELSRQLYELKRKAAGPGGILHLYILPIARRFLAARQLNQLGWKQTIETVEDWDIGEDDIEITHWDGSEKECTYIPLKYFLDNGEELESFEKQQQEIKDRDIERTKTEKENFEYNTYLRLKEQFEGKQVV